MRTQENSGSGHVKQNCKRMTTALVQNLNCGEEKAIKGSETGEARGFGVKRGEARTCVQQIHIEFWE